MTDELQRNQNIKLRLGRDKNPRRQHWRLASPRAVHASFLVPIAPLTSRSWITPSIFENVDPANNIVDEYTLCEKLGREACCSILHQHWSTWTSQADFAKIAAAGINVVRIPIGFWAFSNADSPYCTGAKAYLDKALEWARQTGLKVMIDLHGAPGSQNGFDNSGKRGNVGWLVDGGVGGYTAQYTVTVIQNMAGWYAGPQWDDVVIGIELLNEPFSPKLSMEDLKAFTKEGYRRVRKHSSTRTVIFQDGFMHPAYYNGFLTPWDDNSQLVSIDHHYYHMFDAGLIRMSPAQHLEQVCNAVPSYTGADKWTFIGEWSAGMTDCAKWLNGMSSPRERIGTHD